jgi:hypothetical protein
MKLKSTVDIEHLQSTPILSLTILATINIKYAKTASKHLRWTCNVNNLDQMTSRSLKCPS